MATRHFSITVGAAATVHAARQLDSGTIFKDCGSWANTAGSRAPQIFETTAPVTCHRCLKLAQ